MRSRPRELTDVSSLALRLQLMRQAWGWLSARLCVILPGLEGSVLANVSVHLPEDGFQPKHFNPMSARSSWRRLQSKWLPSSAATAAKAATAP